jgi:RNA polymerase sigma-54 factor
MALEHRLELKMLQKLILTPQLQQAIKLLQLPQIELSQTIADELIENPFLEEVPEDEYEPTEDAESDSYMPDERLAPEERHTEKDDAETPLELGDMPDFTVNEYFDSRSYDGRDLGYFTPDIGNNEAYEQFTYDDHNLYEHLNWQLRFADATPAVLAAAEAVVGNIDENGYLEATSEDIAKFAECDIATAESAIGLVQTFDPPGIAARSLQECLLLQLNTLELRGSLVETLIRESLADIEKRRYAELAQKHSVPVEEVRTAVKVIEGLDPKPGSGLTSAQPVYIKPDVYVVRDADGFQIVLNDESMPNIRINSYYRKLLMNRSALGKEEREYLDERLRSAVWLLKSLDHRNKTIYRVTECIVRFQNEFFREGASHLKPLNLRTVAGELGMHESTISRATANKYLSCAHGLFSFKYFFSSSVNSGAGPVSSISVKELIKKIVAEEDRRKPLSDQKIVTMLAACNITIARRTVAKYRDELRIYPQAQRKKSD